MTAPLADLQLRILENVARGAPADTTLHDLCNSVEPLIPDAIVGITILDRAARVFEHSIFPSLPPTFSEALKGARVAERPGSCALAVFQGSTVVSEDIATDKRFQDGWKAHPRITINIGLRVDAIRRHDELLNIDRMNSVAVQPRIGACRCSGHGSVRCSRRPCRAPY